MAAIDLEYIGLSTAVVLAGVRHRILGMDTNSSHVQAVNASQVPFSESDLGEALREVHAAGLVTASEQAAPADAYIASVPIPFQGDHHTDLSSVMTAADKISPYMSESMLVILESTSPPGTIETMNERTKYSRSDLVGSFLFAYCLERVLPGEIMVEMFTNDRIVGGLISEATQAAQELYASFCRGQICLTDAKTTELSKLAENFFWDVNIALANELTKTCDYLGIDARELIDLANLYPRANILRPGPRMGGHCIAVDPWFIADVVPSLAHLTHTAREVNDSRPNDVVTQAQTLVHEVRVENAGQPTKVTVLSLAFKPDVDDLRSSPAITVADRLVGLDKVELLVCESNTAILPPILTGRSNIRKAELVEGLQDADLVVGLMAHRQFRASSRNSPTVPVLDAYGTWR